MQKKKPKAMILISVKKEEETDVAARMISSTSSTSHHQGPDPAHQKKQQQIQLQANFFWRRLSGMLLLRESSSLWLVLAASVVGGEFGLPRSQWKSRLLQSAVELQQRAAAARAATAERQQLLGAPTITNAYGLSCDYDPEADEHDLIDRLFVKMYLKAGFVKTICFLDMNPGDTIKMLKAKIQDKEGISIDDMWVIHGGRKLKDCRTLSDYFLGDDSMVYVVRADRCKAT